MTPKPGACCETPQKKCMPDPEAWKHAGWQAIFFELSDPHYYSYELVVEPGAFVARAVGDLDCDGELATFELRGTAEPGGGWQVAPEPIGTSPLE
jgi:hypothetical protein